MFHDLTIYSFSKIVRFLRSSKLVTLIIPRRKKDPTLQVSLDPNFNDEKLYKKMSIEEPGGEHYPIFHLQLDQFSDFGLGIGVYFIQVIYLAAVAAVAGCILIPSIIAYANHNYGTNFPNALVTLTAACEDFKIVTATKGCTDVGTQTNSCLVQYRSNCDLPIESAICDLVMCVFILIVLVITSHVDKSSKVRLDENIQTSQDYSVVVSDPNPDATDPDEWNRFFSRFGKYFGMRRDMRYFVEQLNAVDRRLDEAFHMRYNTCRVYVTFEYEYNQRLCLETLRVPVLYSELDWNQNYRSNIAFRGDNILKVAEPPEPDDIVWSNVERVRKGVAIILSGFVLVFCFQLFILLQSYWKTVLPIAVGILKLPLPIQLKLFLGRLLSATVFFAINTKWDAFLDSFVIEQIMLIQFAASFGSPLYRLMDMQGLFIRHIWGPMIFFISIFYSLLVPTSLAVASLSMIAIFFVNQFLLMRRWRPTGMLGTDLVKRVRQALFVAVLIHLYITASLVYSWPMDNAYRHGSGEFEKVDKRPSYLPWDLEKRHWHSRYQTRVLEAFKWTFYACAAVVIYKLIILPISHQINRMLLERTGHTVGRATQIPFQTVMSNMYSYCPLIKNDVERFIVADTRDCLS
eukprot:gene6323-12797_t